MQVTTMELDKVDGRREMFSALADGQLAPYELAQALKAFEADPALRSVLEDDWHTMHLVGDVLRGGEQGCGVPSTGFLERLQVCLAAEPPLAAPAAELAVPEPVRRPVAAEAANDGSFRWKLVAGVASCAAVAAVVWSVAAGGMQLGQPQLAANVPTGGVQLFATAPAAAPASRTVEQAVTLANGESQVMLRDARLDELLAAHKQVGGGAALQMPASFLRSATVAGPER